MRGAVDDDVDDCGSNVAGRFSDEKNRSRLCPGFDFLNLNLAVCLDFTTGFGVFTGLVSRLAC